MVLWPHSVESSSYFRLSEQVSYWLVVVLCSPMWQICIIPSTPTRTMIDEVSYTKALVYYIIEK
jgi:hypothetical protein